MGEKQYQLQPLPYDYKALAPVISEDLLRLHHDKHHAAYVNGANAILQKFEKARKEGTDLDLKAITKEYSFHFGGLFLHERFWQNMGPTGKSGGKPGGRIGDAIEKEFGSFERFKKEFSAVASSVEGSGWAALVFCGHIERPQLVQIEKHNVNVTPQQKVLLVLDVWEHAYYLDYKNDRGKFIENWWNVVNWDAVEKRLP
ncbi:MAG: superoxide dismutase [Methanomassiliicoccales archaeon]|jgi:Fe-Mn family superoxide dismutase|nr:superoxide dismutase [Methanomassiliicoccales archaeon]